MDGEDICYRYRVAICPALNRPVKLARDFVGHEQLLIWRIVPMDRTASHALIFKLRYF